VVSVADGVDRVIAGGSNWGLISFAGEGIYAGVRDPSKQPSLSGLSLIAPYSGQARPITTSGTWTYVANGSAWSASGSGQATQEGIGNQLVSLDLKTGNIRAWYTRTDITFRLLGLDEGGHPILAGASGSVPILRITAPGAADQIGQATYIADAISDSHGLWYVETMSIAIYLIEGSRIRAVVRYGEYGSVRLAGGCHA
jgi:hypothetical protein